MSGQDAHQRLRHSDFQKFTYAPDGSLVGFFENVVRHDSSPRAMLREDPEQRRFTVGQVASRLAISRREYVCLSRAGR